jgi:hypothetical protein
MHLLAKKRCEVGREIVITGHRTWSVQIKVHYLPAKAVLNPEIYVKSANYTAGQAKVRHMIGAASSSDSADCKWRMVHCERCRRNVSGAIPTLKRRYWGKPQRYRPLVCAS